MILLDFWIFIFTEFCEFSAFFYGGILAFLEFRKFWIPLENEASLFGTLRLTSWHQFQVCFLITITLFKTVKSVYMHLNDLNSMVLICFNIY